jgi:hypothetical protein
VRRPKRWNASERRGRSEPGDEEGSEGGRAERRSGGESARPARRVVTSIAAHRSLARADSDLRRTRRTGPRKPSAPEPVRHLGSLSVCRFRVDGGCVEGLDEDANAIPHACLDRGGTLRPPALTTAASRPLPALLR